MSPICICILHSDAFKWYVRACWDKMTTIIMDTLIRWISLLTCFVCCCRRAYLYYFFFIKFSNFVASNDLRSHCARDLSDGFRFHFKPNEWPLFHTFICSRHSSIFMAPSNDNNVNPMEMLLFEKTTIKSLTIFEYFSSFFLWSFDWTLVVLSHRLFACHSCATTKKERWQKENADLMINAECSCHENPVV